MQVYINRKVVRGPYGGGNLFTKAFHELAPTHPDVEVLINTDGRINPDVILLAGLDNDGQDISAEQAIMYKMYVKPSCKIVLRVNENDARKDTRGVDELLFKVSEHVDHTVFVSRWLQEYFREKGWGCLNQSVIYNGVDRDVFRPQPKLNNGKLNIVAHHWSDNPLKGADVYEALDEFVGKNPDSFAFTYVGRHKCNFKHTTVVKPLHGKALGEELGKHDIYVSASRFDPGPNHVLEALSCELPTLVHVAGGGAVEFAGKSHAYRDWSELKHWLMNWPTDRTWPNEWITAADRPIRSWQTCVGEYTALLKKLP